MSHDPEFVSKYRIYPPTFLRLDKNGKVIGENVLRITKDKGVYISGLLRGKGNYFFAYGESDADTGAERYGLITKYANNGNTIWTHTYRHHDYDLS